MVVLTIWKQVFSFGLKFYIYKYILWFILSKKNHYTYLLQQSWNVQVSKTTVCRIIFALNTQLKLLKKSCCFQLNQFWICPPQWRRMGPKNDGRKWEQKIPYIQKIDISIQCMKKTMLKMKKTAYFHHLLDTLPGGWVRHLLPWCCWCQWWQWWSRTSHYLHCSYHLLKEKNTIIITAMPNLSFYI